MNGPDAAFCGNCGNRLAPAMAGGQSPAPGAPSGYGAPGGGAAGYGSPAGYDAPAGYGAPAGYDTPGGYGAPTVKHPAAAYPPPPPPGYGPPSGQPSTGYPPGQYQPGQYQPGQYQPGPGGPNGQRPSSVPPVNFDLNRLNTADRIVGIATLVTMISLWLPWFSASVSVLGITSSASISGTGVHGWLWLEFIVALALLVYLGAKAAWDPMPFRLPVAHERLLVIATGVQFLLILIGFLAVPSGGQGVSVSWDFGAFLALIASIAAAAPVAYPAVQAFRDSRNAASGAPRY